MTVQLRWPQHPAESSWTCALRQPEFRTSDAQPKPFDMSTISYNEFTNDQHTKMTERSYEDSNEALDPELLYTKEYCIGLGPIIWVKGRDCADCAT
jgi:hypothetical protein